MLLRWLWKYFVIFPSEKTAQAITQAVFSNVLSSLIINLFLSATWKYILQKLFPFLPPAYAKTLLSWFFSCSQTYRSCWSLSDIQTYISDFEYRWMWSQPWQKAAVSLRKMWLHKIHFLASFGVYVKFAINFHYQIPLHKSTILPFSWCFFCNLVKEHLQASEIALFILKW